MRFGVDATMEKTERREVTEEGIYKKNRNRKKQE